MLARALPGVAVVVGASRYLAGRVAEQQLGATVHVLDDGFQHLQIARTVDLLLVSEDDLSDLPLPAGRLREPLTAGAVADAVLVSAGYPTAVDRIARAIGVPTAFQITRSLGAPRTVGPNSDTVVVPSQARVFAVAAIAQPDLFFADITAAGWHLVGSMGFRDHHWFTPRDMVRIRAAAKASAAAIILTTDKDAVRLEGCDLGGSAGRGGADPRRRRAGGGVSRLAARPDSMKHRLEYSIVQTLFFVVRLLPDPLVRATGTLLGLTFYALDGAHRRTAHRNLAHAFPGRSNRERKAIARAAFAHFGRLLVELLKFTTLSDEAMLARVEFDGEDRARSAYAQGRGVLFFTGHFGFWELHALAHALRLEPFSVIARPLDNPYLDALLDRVRQRTGNPVIHRQGMMRPVMRTLQAGHGIAVLIDQHIQARDAVYIDFFERPAATTTAIAAPGAPHRRAGGAVLCATRRARTLSLHLRAPDPAAAPRQRERRSRVHAALHGRSGDVRAASS